MAKRACVVGIVACVAVLVPAAADGSTQLASNPAGDQVLVYQVRVQRARALYASVRERRGEFGPLRVIAQPPGVFEPSAFIDDAGGDLVAVARNFGPGSADLAVRDMRDPESGINRTAELVQEGAKHTTGGLMVAARLRRNGAVAWIACPSSGRPGQTFARCRRVGGMTKLLYAWHAAPGSKPRLLDRGSSIRPGSLRLRGSALSWRHGRRVGHARLR
jgi:hypothetical protein